MDLPLFSQGPQSPNVPDGFAIVPIHLFLVMANQWPSLPANFTVATVAGPQSNDSLYERAMTCSLN